MKPIVFLERTSRGNDTFSTRIIKVVTRVLTNVSLTLQLKHNRKSLLSSHSSWVSKTHFAQVCHISCIMHYGITSNILLGCSFREVRHTLPDDSVLDYNLWALVTAFKLYLTILARYIYSKATLWRGYNCLQVSEIIKLIDIVKRNPLFFYSRYWIN